jgi:hypothetical protein
MPVCRVDSANAQHASLSAVLVSHMAAAGFPSVPAARVAFDRELGRGSTGVVFSGFFHDCECNRPPQLCPRTRRVCLKVTTALACVAGGL